MDSTVDSSEWTTEEMEAERPPCFHFFLDECTNGASCNYNHNPIFKANLMGIPQTASKESISEELRSFRPVHIASTGNPSQCNFGRGCGIVGFSSIQDSAPSKIIQLYWRIDRTESLEAGPRQRSQGHSEPVRRRRGAGHHLKPPVQRMRRPDALLRGWCRLLQVLPPDPRASVSPSPPFLRTACAISCLPTQSCNI